MRGTAPPQRSIPNAPPANAYAPPYTTTTPMCRRSRNGPRRRTPRLCRPASAADSAGACRIPIRTPYYHRFPTGAIWLIGLGLLFLVGNIPVFHLFRGRVFAPLLVIGLGVWLFVRRMLSTGQALRTTARRYYHWRLAARAPRLGLDGSDRRALAAGCAAHSALVHSWPLFLIAVGVCSSSSAPGDGYARLSALARCR